MKNLVLGSLIAALASQAAGCIIETDDSTYVSASWSIKHMANNTVIPCPPGYDTAALYNQPVNPDLTPVGDPIVDLFDCAAGGGTSSGLPPGLYLSWLDIANHDNSQTYAKSLAPDFNDDGVPDATDLTFDQSLHFDILEDGGYFQMAWMLKGASSNQTLTCAEAGVGSNGGTAGVQLQAFVSGSNMSTSDIFNCENHYGITGAYLAGSYDVLVDAVNPNPVGSAPTISSRIDAPNKVTMLGTVTIPITGK